MKTFKQLAIVGVLGLAVAMPALARDNIQIAGSSTVLPFASIVAEEFGRTFKKFRAPVVASGGSGGGLRQFCQGIGPNFIDIANSSRPITKAEIENCAKNGVKGIIEVKFGFDGIVFASRRDGGKFALEPRHVFLAGAREVPKGDQMVPNYYTRWSQIDKNLPDQEITLVIPGSNHGTREVYEEKVVFPGCDALPEVKALRAKDAKAATAMCRAIRTDGRVIEIAGDYTETLARLDSQKTAVGVFGLSFYEQNRDRLQVATMSGVVPSIEAIESGKYPVSRPLYFYIKDAHVGVIPGLLEFASFFLSVPISGVNSPVDKAGLIPLNKKDRAEVLTAIKERRLMQ
jgi:phosphate transport system substrate-binding protein